MFMSRWIVAAALAAITLVAARQADANFQTGNDLLRFCEDISDSGYGRCLGYVEGVVDSLEVARSDHHLPPCVREGIGTAQVHNAVIKYLRDHPETREQTASRLVVIAVSSALQCSQPDQ